MDPWILDTDINKSQEQAPEKCSFIFSPFLLSSCLLSKSKKKSQKQSRQLYVHLISAQCLSSLFAQMMHRWELANNIYKLCILSKSEYLYLKQKKKQKPYFIWFLSLFFCWAEKPQLSLLTFLSFSVWDPNLQPHKNIFMTFCSTVKEGTSELLHSVDGENSIQSWPMNLMACERQSTYCSALLCSKNWFLFGLVSFLQHICNSFRIALLSTAV